MNIIFSLLLVAAATQQPADMPRVTAEVQKLVDANQFSGVVLVANNGSPIYERAWGLADVVSKTANTVDTKFNIGSINKAFTKTAIAQLAEAGKLSLDDKVRKYLPDYPSPAADRITIRQLVDHRSGLGDFFGPKYDALPPSKLRELSDFLPLFADQPLQFEPGTQQSYSNAGYIVLGLIIERLTGQKYRDYVQEHVFNPAGMHDTGLWTIDANVPKRSTGYTKHDDEREIDTRIPNTATLPGRPSSAGGGYSTARDLLRLITALRANKLANATWSDWVLPRQPRIAFGGGAPGLNAWIEIREPWTIIAMANFDPPAARDAAIKVADVITGRTEASGPRNGAIPLTRAQDLAAVEASVNGKGPYHFAIDTGAAGGLRVSSELAHSLGLETVGEVTAGDPSGKNNERRSLARVRSFKIGTVELHDLDAIVRSGGGPAARDVDGTIGLGVFKDYTVKIDYRNGDLFLSREPLPPNAPHVIPFTFDRGVPEIEIDLAGQTHKADVDSGSPALLSVPAAWEKTLTFASEPRVAGRGRTATNEFEIRAAELKGDLRVAGQVVTNPQVDIIDLFPVANIGSQFWSDCVVTFDMPNGRVRIEK